MTFYWKRLQHFSSWVSHSLLLTCIWHSPWLLNQGRINSYSCLVVNCQLLQFAIVSKLGRAVLQQFQT